VQSIKDIEYYLENTEKYAQFKEFSMDDHLTVQALVSQNFTLIPEDQ
jgi:hypothetical protein